MFQPLTFELGNVTEIPASQKKSIHNGPADEILSGKPTYYCQCRDLHCHFLVFLTMSFLIFRFSLTGQNPIKKKWNQLSFKTLSTLTNNSLSSREDITYVR